MKIWLKDEKTKIECGINNDGELFLGDDKSGYNLIDTPENRENVINDFYRYTGKKKPNCNLNCHKCNKGNYDLWFNCVYGKNQKDDN